MARKALVIERDELMVDALAYLLSGMGFEIERDFTIDSLASKCPECDLIFVEIDNPDQLNLFLEHGRDLNIPVLVSSGDYEILDTCRQNDVGNEYILKPFNISDFEKKVKGAVAMYY